MGLEGEGVGVVSRRNIRGLNGVINSKSGTVKSSDRVAKEVDNGEDKLIKEFGSETARDRGAYSDKRRGKDNQQCRTTETSCEGGLSHTQ